MIPFIYRSPSPQRCSSTQSLFKYLLPIRPCTRPMTLPLHQASGRGMAQDVHGPVSMHPPAGPEGINLNTRIDPDPASETVDPPAQAAATFIDGSDLLFSMYNKMTAEQDRKAAKNWRSDADSAVIVNGLFSVMVAILLGRSYQDLRLNPQDVSAFYLSQIYQLSAGLNGTSTPLPFKVSDPSTFSPAPSSVRASALWSLSLVISLACTVIATLLRQWTRRYLHITQEPRGPRNRARIRELVARGIEMEQLQRLYCFASVIPLSLFGDISYTPLSSFVWFSWSRIVWLTHKLLYNASIRLSFIGHRTQHHFWELARARLSWTLRATAVDMDDLAHKRSSSLDTSMVSRVFDSLDGHEDMEQFLSAIPGFYHSSEVKRDVSVLEGLNDKQDQKAAPHHNLYTGDARGPLTTSTYLLADPPNLKFRHLQMR
ncbi:hypothetical protein BJY52DRAFT_761636 [Lactarius psammicola]|nr:hypothetical protein BJY52DRAFT_761636 [Lactarius psammicola]